MVPGVCTLAFFISRDDRDEHGEAAAVVADARPAQDRAVALHLDVRALRKHGVEMRGDHDDADAARRLDKSPSTFPTLSTRTFCRPSC